MLVKMLNKSQKLILLRAKIDRKKVLQNFKGTANLKQANKSEWDEIFSIMKANGHCGQVEDLRDAMSNIPTLEGQQ